MSYLLGMPVLTFRCYTSAPLDKGLTSAASSILDANAEIRPAVSLSKRNTLKIA